MLDLAWAIVCGPLHGSDSQFWMLIRRKHELLNNGIARTPHPQILIFLVWDCLKLPRDLNVQSTWQVVALK